MKDVRDQLTKYTMCTFKYLRKNPHLSLSISLFVFGSALINSKASMVAGALFGAGASLLGAWITEINTRRSKEQDRIKQESEAKKYLSPELLRIIERTLHIHRKTVASVQTSSAFSVYSAMTPSKDIPSDLKQFISRDLMEDITPYIPVLYPNVEQFKHLTSADAVSLIAFYDSIYELDAIIKDWWERESRLHSNIYFQIVQKSGFSLKLAKACIDKFELETNSPKQTPLLIRIQNSLDLVEEAMNSMESAQSTIAKHFPPASKKDKTTYK